MVYLVFGDLDLKVVGPDVESATALTERGALHTNGGDVRAGVGQTDGGVGYATAKNDGGGASSEGGTSGRATATGGWTTGGATPTPTTATRARSGGGCAGRHGMYLRIVE